MATCTTQIILTVTGIVLIVLSIIFSSIGVTKILNKMYKGLDSTIKAADQDRTDKVMKAFFDSFLDLDNPFLTAGAACGIAGLILTIVGVITWVICANAR